MHGEGTGPQLTKWSSLIQDWWWSVQRFKENACLRNISIIIMEFMTLWCCYVISTFRFPWNARGLNNMTFMQITLCKEDYPVKWPSSPGVSCSPVVIRSPDQCPEVTSSIPPWEIFSIIPSPVAKQPSLTSFIHSCCQYHSIFDIKIVFNYWISQLKISPA